MHSITLPAEPMSVGLARQFVLSTLLDRVDDPSTVLLLTSELVTNVVRHAATDVTVRVQAGPPLRVEVQDGAAATEAFREMIALRPPDVPGSALGGRGLLLVHDLATRVGLDDAADHGKVVWFELSDPRA